MRPLRAWNLFPEWKMAIGAAAKAGSTSLAVLSAEVYGDYLSDARRRRVFFGEVPEDSYQVIGVIRHPIDRFYSLYENIQTRKRSKHNFYSKLEGKGPDELFEAIVNAGLHHDIHFQPQTSIMIAQADILVKLETLSEWWDKNRPESAPQMPIENKSAHYDGPAMSGQLIESVASLYKKDLALWEVAE